MVPALRKRCTAGSRPEGGEGNKSLVHKKPDQAAHKAYKHNINRIGAVQRKPNQHHEILSDENVRRTDRDLQRDTGKEARSHGRRGEQRVP